MASRLIAIIGAMIVTAACGGGPTLVYPLPPEEPGTEWPPSTGLDCSGTFAACVDASLGSGEPVRAFAQVTMRVTVEETQPPATRGPIMLTFVYPTLDKIPFRGRDRDLSTFMFTDEDPGRAGGEPFFTRDAPAMFGPYIIGMRMGGTRRVSQGSAGKLGPFNLPSDQGRHFVLSLVQVCYPKVFVTPRLRMSWFDGSGGPIVYDPRLSVEGCGQ